MPGTEIRPYMAIRDAFNTIDWPRNMCTATTGGVMLALMSAMKARVCVEIGIWEGFITELMASGLHSLGGGTLFSCDIYERYCEGSRAIGARFAPSVWHIIFRQPSQTIDWVQELSKAGHKTVDIAFIDGDHEYTGATADLNKISAVLSPGGFMVVHDYHVCGAHQPARYPEVDVAIDDFLAAHPKYNRIEIPTLRGFNQTPALIIQSPPPEEWVL